MGYELRVNVSGKRRETLGQMIPGVSKKREPFFRARELEGYRREGSVRTVAKEFDFCGCYFRFVYFLLYLITMSIQPLC